VAAYQQQITLLEIDYNPFLFEANLKNDEASNNFGAFNRPVYRTVNGGR